MSQSNESELLLKLKKHNTLSYCPSLSG
uniref:Uncharacterized protein n=1 Tax=Rhizophora mucronata TaxID=61149 RepID=A0A2P2PWD2_RHIMU